MGTSFQFETAPELPGADRVARVFLVSVRGLTHWLWDFTIEGAENVPLDGPALITPNHLSFCDSVFVPAALPRRAWAIGKGEYMDDWKTKHLFPALGMIPVDRSGGDAAQAALDTAATVLDGGHLFMIYPEGTRSRSGFLHKGRTGAARLAIRCNAPVVPVGHEGTLAIQPPDAFTMKIRLPITVRFGKPMWAREYGDVDDPRTLRSFTDAIMYEISQLSGQQYVDVYAGKDDTPGHPAAGEPGTPKKPKKQVPVPATGAGAADGIEPSDTEHTRITPRRPSVIGESPGRISTPTRPTRPTTASDAPRPSITVPPGRAAAQREATAVAGD